MSLKEATLFFIFVIYAGIVFGMMMTGCKVSQINKSINENYRDEIIDAPKDEPALQTFNPNEEGN